MIFPSVCTVGSSPHNCIRQTKLAQEIHTAPTHQHDTRTTLMFGEREESKSYYARIQEQEWTGCLETNCSLTATAILPCAAVTTHHTDTHTDYLAFGEPK